MLTTNGVIELDHSFTVVGPKGNSLTELRSGYVLLVGNRIPMFRCIGFNRYPLKVIKKAGSYQDGRVVYYRCTTPPLVTDTD